MSVSVYVLARACEKKNPLTRLRPHFACNLLEWLVLNFCQIKENRGRGNCVRMEVMSFLLTRAEPEMKGSYGGAAVASMGGCKQETLRHTTSISNADTFVIPYQPPNPPQPTDSSLQLIAFSTVLLNFTSSRACRPACPNTRTHP